MHRGRYAKTTRPAAASLSGIRKDLTLARVDLIPPSRYTSTCTSGSSSVVECFLAKEDVAGSTPVSRSNSAFSALHFSSSWLNSAVIQDRKSSSGARYPSGKGEVCKTFMRRFDPDPRLHYFNNLQCPTDVAESAL